MEIQDVMSSDKPDSNATRLARIRSEASQWVIRQHAGMTAQEEDDFFDWLASDPEHSELYAKCQQTWKQLDSLAQWRPEHSTKANPDLFVVEPFIMRTFRGILSYSIAAAALLIVGLFVWKLVLDDYPKAQKLSQGEYAYGYERHVLDDGSVVELSLGAQVTVHYTEQLRHVALNSGEAHFTIAKDVNRPFVVMANGVAVEAVGTVFNVQLGEGAVNVLVTEGRVRVAPSQTPDTVLLEDRVADTYARELTAGQRSVIKLDDSESKPIIQTLSDYEIEEELTWCTERHDERAGDHVAVEFHPALGRMVGELDVGELRSVCSRSRSGGALAGIRQRLPDG